MRRRHTKAQIAAAARAWDEATLSNDYLFNRVMQQKYALLPTLQRLVPELAIKKLVHITTQHSFKATYDSRGFRLDIFAEDQNGRRLDLEMQVVNHHDLLKRAACYQAMMIDEQLEEGDFYQRLRPVYVIFITMFDPFGGHHQVDHHRLYSEHADQQRLPSLVNYLFINAASDEETTAPALRRLCAFIRDGTVDPSDPLILKLEQVQRKAKQNKKWRREAMRYNLAAQDAKWAELQAEEKGIERGMAKGMTKGMDQAMLAMIETLAEQGMPKEQIITTIAKARKLSLLAARQYYNQLMLSK